MTGGARADPYAPPKASLELTPAAPSDLHFFTASPVKLALLSVATWNLYMLYWFYMNFRAIRARESSAIMPFWRAFFSPFWSYACFRRQGEASPAGLRRGTAMALSAGYFAMAIVSALPLIPDPYWMISLGEFAFLYLPNRWARQANLAADPSLEENARFTTANWIWIVLGGAFLVLVLWAMLTEAAQKP